MRAFFLVLTSALLVLTGCKPVKELPTEVNVAPEPNVPNGPDQPQAPGEKELLAKLAPFGAHENSNGKKPGAPLHIAFRGKEFSDDDLGKMRPILLRSQVLIKLNLNGCERITDAGLAHLKDVPTIRVLQIENRNKKVTDDGLKPLATLTDLEELSISGDAITDAGLAHIGKLTKLRRLWVSTEGTTDAGYAHLAGLVNLEEIHVGKVPHYLTDECLRHMKGMSKLKELTLRDKITDAGMAHVKNLVGLQVLWMSTTQVTSRGFANLAPLTKLRKLTLQYVSNLEGESLGFLDGMTDLRELDVSGFSFVFDKTAAAHVGKLAALKKLRPGVVGEGGLEGIAGLTGLEELDLGKPNIYGQPNIHDADMKPLAGLTSLRILYLAGTKVTDAGIKHLAGLPNLSHFAADDNNITDASLPFIATISKLDRLALTDCKLTGSGLKELTKLTKLKYMWLNGNPVTDEYVMALKDVRGLESVYLTGTKVSDEVALELKKARPDLEVSDSAGKKVALNKKPEIRPKRPTEDITKVEPAFTFTAAEYHKECKADREKAAAKFEAKVIEVSGEVDSVHRDDEGACSVWLKVDKELIGVMCNTVDEKPWVRVAKGQKVKIKGQWPAFPFGASLANCVFVEVGAFTGVSLTTAELATEWATDSEATIKKYAKKSVVLTGEVVTKEFSGVGAATFTLKTGGKTKVMCTFDAWDKDMAKPIKIGQTIKVVGDLTFNIGGSDTVQLYTCRPMP